MYFLIPYLVVFAIGVFVGGNAEIENEIGRKRIIGELRERVREEERAIKELRERNDVNSEKRVCVINL